MSQIGLACVSKSLLDFFRAFGWSASVHHPLLSLIVPVWRDDVMLLKLLRALPVEAFQAEWIVASVEPSEPLQKLHEQGVIQLLICDRPSRGEQMNRGATAARGALFCFHHADSELQLDHLRSLREIYENTAIVGGAFHRQFDQRHPAMQRFSGLVRRVNARVGPFFGDQSIFVRREIFEKMGGFPTIPLMEDLEFSNRLRRQGQVQLLDPPMTSSARRFERLGRWKTTAFNAFFIGMFYLGVDPHTLHRWYYRPHLVKSSE